MSAHALGRRRGLLPCSRGAVSRLTPRRPACPRCRAALSRNPNAMARLDFFCSARGAVFPANVMAHAHEALFFSQSDPVYGVVFLGSRFVAISPRFSCEHRLPLLK